MSKKDVFTWILAGAGSALVWFTVLAPLLLSAFSLISSHRFRFDYLMPAELFPFAFSGGGLLLWAAVRAHSLQRLIGWGLAIAVVLLAGSQALALVTGLASGRMAPTGWLWVLVLSTLGIYSLAVIAMGIGGAALMAGLSKALHPLAESS
jgi:hypothetical protein